MFLLSDWCKFFDPIQICDVLFPTLCSCIDEVTSGRRISRWSKGGSQWKAQSCFESSINFLEIVLSLLSALIWCVGLEEYRKSRKLRERAKKDTARWHFMTFCLLHCESLLLRCRTVGTLLCRKFHTHTEKVRYQMILKWCQVLSQPIRGFLGWCVTWPKSLDRIHCVHSINPSFPVYTLQLYNLYHCNCHKHPFAIFVAGTKTLYKHQTYKEPWLSIVQQLFCNISCIAMNELVALIPIYRSWGLERELHIPRIMEDALIYCLRDADPTHLVKPLQARSLNLWKQVATGLKSLFQELQPLFPKDLPTKSAADLALQLHHQY